MVTRVLANVPNSRFVVGNTEQAGEEQASVPVALKIERRLVKEISPVRLHRSQLGKDVLCLRRRCISSRHVVDLWNRPARWNLRLFGNTARQSDISLAQPDLLDESVRVRLHPPADDEKIAAVVDLGNPQECYLIRPDDRSRIRDSQPDFKRANLSLEDFLPASFPRCRLGMRLAIRDDLERLFHPAVQRWIGQPGSHKPRRLSSLVFDSHRSKTTLG